MIKLWESEDVESFKFQEDVGTSYVIPYVTEEHILKEMKYYGILTEETHLQLLKHLASNSDIYISFIFLRTTLEGIQTSHWRDNIHCKELIRRVEANPGFRDVTIHRKITGLNYE